MGLLARDMSTSSHPTGLHALSDVRTGTRYSAVFASDQPNLKTAYTSMPSLPTRSKLLDAGVDWCKSFPNVQVEQGASFRLLPNKYHQKENSKHRVTSGLERPVKNLLVLSTGWMFYFMAFFSLRSLQSSINHVAGLGLASLACIYAGFLLGCLFTIPIVRRLGTKKVLVAGLVCHLVYVAANIHPLFYTVIPSSLLAGFSQVLMWTAQGAYLIKLSKSGSSKSANSLTHTASVYFGIFFLFYSISPVFGSILTSVLMKTDHRNNTLPSNLTYQYYVTNNGTNAEYNADYHWTNFSQPPFERPTKLCGINFCHTELHNDDAFILPLQTRIIIIGAYVISMLLSLTIFALFLDESRETCHVTNRPALVSQFKALLEFVQNPRFHLLAPLIFYLGIQTSFHSGEITKAYVTCLYGMEMVGFSMACFGCSAGISACLTGYLARYLNRVAIIFLGFFVNISSLLIMGLWIPTEDSLVWVLVLVSLWGLADGIWITHVNCETGLLFPNDTEAAYTAFQFMIALGLVVGYSVSQYLCMLTKLYTVGVFAVIGMVGFIVLKWQLRPGDREIRKCSSH